jgi:nitrite reductase (NADH) small subunit
MNLQRIRIGDLEDLPLRRGVLVRAGDQEIAVWQAEGNVYAISAVCAHQHIATLHEGIRSGTTIGCPLHGWSYDLTSGKNLTEGGTLRTYPIIVEGGVVYIEVDQDA